MAAFDSHKHVLCSWCESSSHSSIAWLVVSIEHVGTMSQELNCCKRVTGLCLTLFEGSVGWNSGVVEGSVVFDCGGIVEGYVIWENGIDVEGTVGSASGIDVEGTVRSASGIDVVRSASGIDVEGTVRSASGIDVERTVGSASGIDVEGTVGSASGIDVEGTVGSASGIDVEGTVGSASGIDVSVDCRLGDKKYFLPVYSPCSKVRMYGVGSTVFDARMPFHVVSHRFQIVPILVSL